MRGLNEKVVIVAGGASSIGAATARRLAEEGARVVVGGTSIARTKVVADEIIAGGGQAVAVEFDMTDEDSIQALIAAAVERFGGLDGLHNNAADSRAHALDTDIVDVDLEVWQRTLDVNLTGYFLTARHAIPEMLKRGGGVIVNSSSRAAFSGEAERVSYSVSKAGVNALTRHISGRWGKQGIRCNALAIGLTPNTATAGDNRPGRTDRLMEQLRSPRLGRPEDTAALVAFLMSDDGEWINGQVYGVDGGLMLR